MKTSYSVNVIDISKRNYELGKMAIKSRLGPKKFIKAAVIYSLIYNTGSSFTTHLPLMYEMVDYINDLVAESSMGQGYSEQEHEVMVSNSFKEIKVAAGYLRNKTYPLKEEIESIKQLSVNPDFTRGIIIVKYRDINDD